MWTILGLGSQVAAVRGRTSPQGRGKLALRETTGSLQTQDNR